MFFLFFAFLFLSPVQKGELEESPEIQIGILNTLIQKVQGDSLGKLLYKRAQINILLENYGYAKRDIINIIQNPFISDEIKGKVLDLFFEVEKDTFKANDIIYRIILDTGPFLGKEKKIISLIIFYQAENNLEKAITLSKYLAGYKPDFFQKGQIFLLESLLLKKEKEDKYRIYHLAENLKNIRKDYWIKSLFIIGDSLKGFFELASDKNSKGILNLKFLKEENIFLFDNSLDFEKSGEIFLLSGNKMDSVEAGKRILLSGKYERAEKLLPENELYKNFFYTLYKIRKYLELNRFDSIPFIFPFIKNKIPLDTFYTLKRDYFMKRGEKDSIYALRKTFEKYGIEYFLPFKQENTLKIFIEVIREKGTFDALIQKLFESGDYKTVLSLLKDKEITRIFLQSLYYSFLKNEEGLEEYLNRIRDFQSSNSEDSLLIGKIFLQAGDTSSSVKYLPLSLKEGKILSGRIEFQKKNFEKSLALLKLSPYFPDKIKVFECLLNLERIGEIQKILKKKEIKEILKYKKGREFLIKYYAKINDWNSLYTLYNSLYPEYWRDISENIGIFANTLYKKGKIIKAFLLCSRENEKEEIARLYAKILYENKKFELLKRFLITRKEKWAYHYLSKIFYEEKNPDSLALFLKELEDSIVLKEKTFLFYAKGEIEKGDSIALKNGFSLKDSLYFDYFNAVKLLRKNQLQKAETLFLKTLSHEQIKPYSLFHLGSIEWTRGNFRMAKKFFKQGVMNAKNDLKKELLYNLCITMARLEEDSVVYVYQNIIKDYPGEEEWFWALGKMADYYLSKGELERAYQYIVLISGESESAEKEMEIKFTSGEILRGLLRLKPALQEFLILYRNYPKSLFTITAGMYAAEIYEIKGYTNKTIEICNEIVRDNKGTPFAEEALKIIRRLQKK